MTPEEIVARSMCLDDCQQNGRAMSKYPDGNCPPEGCGYWKDYVRASAKHLTALSNAGFVVVPREPTDKMLDHAATTHNCYDEGNYRAVWQFMLSACEEKK